MIFTVGRTEAYEQYFREQSVPMKRGRDDDYEGGSVWRTASEASAAAPAGYSVYGVDADWSVDTAPSPTGPWRSLLRDAALIRVDPAPAPG